MTLHKAISRFGLEAGSKLANPAATGAPEEQLRGRPADPAQRNVLDHAASGSS